MDEKSNISIDGHSPSKLWIGVSIGNHNKQHEFKRLNTKRNYGGSNQTITIKSVCACVCEWIRQAKHQGMKRERNFTDEVINQTFIYLSKILALENFKQEIKYKKHTHTHAQTHTLIAVFYYSCDEMNRYIEL